jgi:hypothetical protein
MIARASMLLASMLLAFGGCVRLASRAVGALWGAARGLSGCLQKISLAISGHTFALLASLLASRNACNASHLRELAMLANCAARVGAAAGVCVCVCVMHPHT